MRLDRMSEQNNEILAHCLFSTKNQFSSKPQGLRPTQDTQQKLLFRAHVMEGGIILLGPYFYLLSKIKGSKIGHTKVSLPPSNASRRELIVGGLGFVVSPTVCWQIIFLCNYRGPLIQLYCLRQYTWLATYKRSSDTNSRISRCRVLCLGVLFNKSV